jgi:hypothetical protein
VRMPDGAVRMPDGAVRMPDGAVCMPDGAVIAGGSSCSSRRRMPIRTEASVVRSASPC